MLKAFSPNFEWKKGNKIEKAYVWVLLDLNDWNLSIDDIFIKEKAEAHLAKVLSKKFLVGRCPEKSQLVGDIILFDKSLKPLSLIEITKLKPNSGDIHGGSAAARIYQLIKAVMTKYVSKGGLILPISWKSRIEQDKEFLQKFNIHIIFTSFEKRWEDIVLKRIQNYLN